MSEGNWNLSGRLSIHVQAGPCLLCSARWCLGNSVVLYTGLLHSTCCLLKSSLKGLYKNQFPPSSQFSPSFLSHIYHTPPVEASTVTVFRSRSHRKCRPGVSLCPAPSASVLDLSPSSVSFQEICPALFCVQGAYHARPRPGGDCPHRGPGPWFPRALLPLWGQWHPQSQTVLKPGDPGASQRP